MYLINGIGFLLVSVLLLPPGMLDFIGYFDVVVWIVIVAIGILNIYHHYNTYYNEQYHKNIRNRLRLLEKQTSTNEDETS